MTATYKLRDGEAAAPSAILDAIAALIAAPGRTARVRQLLTGTLASGLDGWTLGESSISHSAELTAAEIGRLGLCVDLVRAIEAEGGDQPTPITGPSDVLAHVQDLRTAHQERVVALYLDARHRPLRRELVAIGGLRASVVQPRDVLAPALQLPAAALILVHNHPSGDCRPSPEDVEVTRQLAAAARLLGLELLDHLVVTARHCQSLRELGHLPS